MNSILRSGTCLGRYEIRDPFGAGGRGIPGEDLRLHRKVALKVLPPEVASNKDRISRVAAESFP